MLGPSKILATAGVALVCSVGTPWLLRQEVGAQTPEPDPAVAVPAGDRAALAARVDAIIAEATGAGALAGARFGLQVRALRSGESLLERDPDGRYNIASNTKVLTAAAALHYLGPAHSFRTELRAERLKGDTILGDLYVVGDGDPSLSANHLRALASSLARLGVRRIRGGITVDDSLYDDQVLPPHFDAQPKEKAAFRAPVSSVSLNSNAIALWVRAAPSGQGPAIITVEPPNAYIKVLGSIQTTPDGRSTVRIESKQTASHQELTVGGQFPLTKGLKRYRLRVAAPVPFFASALRTALRAQGIRVTRKRVRRGASPDNAVVLAAHTSRPLAELIRSLGKHSNNFAAEMLLKAVGASTIAASSSAPNTKPRPATWNDGLQAVRRYLQSRAGLVAASYQYENGSGLFDASELSPRQMVKVLSQVAKDPRHRADLLSSLSIAGVDGTLRRRMKNRAPTGVLRAKTGTLASVSALSGYIATDALEPVCFAFFINDQPTTRKAKKAGRAALDEIAEAVAQYLGSSSP